METERLTCVRYRRIKGDGSPTGQQMRKGNERGCLDVGILI